MEYDGLWVAVNDQIVSYYMTECEPDDNGNWVTRGYIPVLLNGERANLIVEYSGEEENGAIIGAEMVYEDLQTDGKLVPYINEQAALSGEFADADVNGEFIGAYQMINKPGGFDATEDCRRLSPAALICGIALDGLFLMGFLI